MAIDPYSRTIEKLKRSVTDMIAERSAIAAGDSAEKPSPIWAEVVGVYKYLMNLSPEDFRNIRLQTELINGTLLVARYWHPYPKLDPETEARDLGYIKAIEDVPAEYHLGEPPTPGLPRPLGVEYRGRVVNANIVRYQTCVSNLYLAGAFNFLAQAAEKRIVMEVGGGYGGLAHGLMNILGGTATYVALDLPEMLLIQGAFLALHNPSKRIYVYDRATFTEEFVRSSLNDYDLALLPNYVMKRLDRLEKIALFINMQSFQEMSEEQITSYLGFAQRKVSYCLYSDNMDRHPYNGGSFSLTRLLRERFDLYPQPDLYDWLFRGLDPLNYTCYKRYLAFAPGVDKPDAKTLERIFVHGVRRPVEARAVSKFKRALRSIPGWPYIERFARAMMQS